MSSYFINNRISHGQCYRNLKAYRHCRQQQGQHAVMTVSNTLQLYKILTEELALQSKHQFGCNIAKIEVIPSIQHASDFVWILDELGRFGFWNPESRLEIVSNSLLSDSYYQTLPYDQNNIQVMSGISCAITQRDTIGTIFFTIQRKLVFIEFAVKKEGVLLGKVWQEQIKMPKNILYVNWIRNSSGDLFLGLVVQQANSTSLQAYQFIPQESILSNKPVWIFQKKNILHFRAASNGDILIVTFDEVALHRFKQNHPIKCYRTKGNYGQGFCLDNGFYGHIGRQLAIFSKDELRPYNEFKFPDESIFEVGGFLESSCLASIQNGSLILGLITHWHQVYLLRIVDKKCLAIKQNFGLFAVSALQFFEDHSNVFALAGRKSQSHHQVVISNRVYSAKVEKEQPLAFKVDHLVSTLRGSFLIIGIGFSNYVLRMTRDQQHQFYFDLPEGQIINASEHLLVLSNGIYQLDYQAQSAKKIVEQDILLVQIIHEIVYYLNSKGQIIAWNSSEYSSFLLAEDHTLDYCWGKTLNTFSIICANSATPKEIQIISEEGSLTIPINGLTLISCLSSIAIKNRRESASMNNQISEKLLIGYSNGSVHVESYNGDLLYCFELLQDNYVMFWRVSEGKMVVTCGKEQYVLLNGVQGIQMRQIQLSKQGSTVSHVCYLSKSNKLVYIRESQQGQFLRLSQPFFQNQISKLVSICQSDSLPFTKTIKNTIIIANNSQIYQYNLKKRDKGRQLSLGFNSIYGFQSVQIGYIVVGLGKGNGITIVVFNQNLQTINRVTLGLNKPIRIVKSIKGTNDFFLWSESNVSLHRIDSFGQIRLLFGSQLEFQTYSASLNSEDSLFLINDPDRYLSVYSYSPKINHIENLLPSYTISSAAFISKNILVSDQRGCLSLFSIDTQHSIINRTNFLLQGTLNIGQPIQAIYEDEQLLYYVTQDCSIYQLRSIEKQDFDLLHRLQENMLNLETKSIIFSYYKWRSKCQCDKIIDGSYLSMILRDEKHRIRSQLEVEKYIQIIDRLSP